MRESRFTEAQIIRMIKKQEAGSVGHRSTSLKTKYDGLYPEAVIEFLLNSRPMVDGCRPSWRAIPVRNLPSARRRQISQRSSRLIWLYRRPIAIPT